MDGEQIASLIPQLLEGRYPGQYRQPDPVEVVQAPNGWALEQEDALCFIRPGGTAHPFVWIKVGAAIEIPRSSELAYHVACANKQLDVGRAYLGYGEEFALVIIDETVRAQAVSFDFEASIDGLVVRFETSLNQVRTMGAEILEKFGGRRFVRDDLVQLVV
jgi:hypothetical protein